VGGLELSSQLENEERIGTIYEVFTHARVYY
jgi:hypothetical protein